MILSRSFFRKKRTRIYIIIFSILFVAILLVNEFKNYYKNEITNFMYERTNLIVYTDEKHIDLIKNEKRIKTSQRALSFGVGKDNDVIWTPHENDDIKSDTSEKINWSDLIYSDETILAFPSSYCDVNLAENQVMIFTEKATNFSTFTNKEINFKFKDDDISLTIKDIAPPQTNSYICVSNSLYNRLANKEERYIYYVEAKNYKSLEDLKDDWRSIRDDNFYFSSGSYLKDNESVIKGHIENLVNIFNIVSIMSSIIFLSLTIFLIRDLVNDEKKYIILLKETGFNKLQNMYYFFINMLILDLIVSLTSLFLYFLVNCILNKVLNFRIYMFENNIFILLILFTALIEMIFSFICISKN